MCQDCLKDMAKTEEAGKPFPIKVSNGVAIRTRVGSYVPGLTLTKEERIAVRRCTAWVVFRDSKARAGWRVVMNYGWGYYFRTPPPVLLKRLQQIIPVGTPAPRSENVSQGAEMKMHESELKLNAVYDTPTNNGRSWSHAVRYVGQNRKGTKFYFEDVDSPGVPTFEVGRRAVRKLKPEQQGGMWTPSTGFITQPWRCRVCKTNTHEDCSRQFALDASQPLREGR